MSRSPFIPIAALLSLLVATGALAQTDLKPRPNATPSPTVTRPPGRAAAGRERVTTRIAVGERAPDFELDQSTGKPLRLSSLRGQWVLLFFVERRESLDVVQPIASALTSFGARTVAVCYDKSHVLARRLAGKEISYVALADPTGDIVSLYGLLDSGTDEARPGCVLLTPKGEVRIAVLGHALPGPELVDLVRYAVTGQ
jgi:peroxiredoxin